MTSIVGIKCSNGVVIGADSATTMVHGQLPTVEQPSDKISIIQDRVIVAGTGAVGLAQRFETVIEDTWNAPEVKNGSATHIQIGVHLSNATRANFKLTGYFPDAPYQRDAPFGALVAFSLNSETHLCQFELGNLQPEFQTEKIWYCSMGSAQGITDPFLAFIREVFWDGGLPTVREAVFAATWTLSHAIAINPGGVNGPVRIAILEDGANPTARILEDAELEEHRQCLREAKNTLREFRQSYVVKASDTNVPSIPQLEE